MLDDDDVTVELWCLKCGAQDHGCKGERWMLGSGCPVCWARHERAPGRVGVRRVLVAGAPVVVFA